MSALSFISNYGSSSDESDCNDNEHSQQPQHKKTRFQVPDLSNVPVVSSESHLDNPQDHDGRVRSFPHVRGNWATFVYVKYPSNGALQKISQKILKTLFPYKDLCHIVDNIHISLSKTVVLQYHMISSFTKSIQEAFNSIQSFALEFSGIKVYCNEDNTRTFIALEVHYFSKKKLLKYSQIVDDVLNEFKLPLFYENPSFHMSLIWLNGNNKAEVKALMTDVIESLNEEVRNEIEPLLVSDLNCKIGNKFFQFSLQ